MPDPLDVSQAVPPILSLLGGTTLHFAREFFDRTKDVEARKRDCIKELRQSQVTVVLRLIDDELQLQGRGPDPLDAEDYAALDGARQEQTERAVDVLWEDALRARKLELWWQGWCGWERLGRKACEIGRLACGLLFVLAAVFLVAGSPFGFPQGVSLALSVGAIAVPSLIAFVAWFPATVLEHRTMRFLETPRRGMHAPRWFGDA